MPSKQENKRFNHVFRTHKNNQILYTLQLSHFSLIFRYLQKQLNPFCYERLYYLSKRRQKRRNGFSQNHEQKVALGAKKMCLRWHFSPPQKAKREG